MPREKHPWELFTPEQFAAMCRIAKDKIEAERRKFREEQEALKHRPYSPPRCGAKIIQGSWAHLVAQPFDAMLCSLPLGHKGRHVCLSPPA
jgi:hypothetical protein